MKQGRVKIAQVITRMDRGGAPDIVRSICESLSDRYEITLITGLSRNPDSRTVSFLEKFKGNVITAAALRRNINPLMDMAAFVQLFLIFRRGRFDIVHTHTSKAGFIGRLAARLAGTKNIIYMPHGHVFYGYFNRAVSCIFLWLERLAGVFTDRIVALTELEKRDLADSGVLAPDKIEIISSGIDTDRKEISDKDRIRKKNEFSVNPDERLVVMAGRLEAVKGPGVFLECALVLLEEFDDVKFLAAGDGSLKSELTAQCRELGISKSFIFAGWREDIFDILAMSDVVVLPSLNEAVGRVLLEAGICGIPAVASRVGGVPEIISDRQTGILVEPSDAVGMAEAVSYLLRHKDVRIGMGQAARERVSALFSESSMIAGFDELYSGILQRTENR